MKKTGIFGGTFDPIHNAHLILAEFVRTELSFNSIMFMPSFKHPNKDIGKITSIEDRLKMLELAVEDNEYFEISDLEINMKDAARSFTINTLQKLKEIYKDEHEFYLIIGMDNLADFHNWNEPEKVLEMTKVVVMNRPGYESEKVKKDFTEKVQLLDTPYLEISATNIRRRIKENRSVRYMIPEKVLEYININKLYR